MGIHAARWEDVEILVVASVLPVKQNGKLAVKSKDEII